MSISLATPRERVEAFEQIASTASRMAAFLTVYRNLGPTGIAKLEADRRAARAPRVTTALNPRRVNEDRAARGNAADRRARETARVISLISNGTIPIGNNTVPVSPEPAHVALARAIVRAGERARSGSALPRTCRRSLRGLRLWSSKQESAAAEKLHEQHRSPGRA
jgi:hypothetical protein